VMNWAQQRLQAIKDKWGDVKNNYPLVYKTGLN
jgi:hypothetical protein